VSISVEAANSEHCTRAARSQASQFE